MIHVNVISVCQRHAEYEQLDKKNDKKQERATDGIM